VLFYPSSSLKIKHSAFFGQFLLPWFFQTPNTVLFFAGAVLFCFPTHPFLFLPCPLPCRDNHHLDRHPSFPLWPHFPSGFPRTSTHAMSPLLTVFLPAPQHTFSSPQLLMFRTCPSGHLSGSSLSVTPIPRFYMTCLLPPPSIRFPASTRVLTFLFSRFCVKIFLSISFRRCVLFCRSA